MWSAVDCLRSACALPRDIYNNTLKPPTSDNTGSHQKRVIEMCRAAESKSVMAEGERRVHLLQVEYEVKLLEKDAERGVASEGRTEGSVAAAERVFAHLAATDLLSVRKARKSARPYLCLSLQRNGLGLVFMLGSQTRTL